jgi:hypothetical protein
MFTVEPQELQAMMLRERDSRVLQASFAIISGHVVYWYVNIVEDHDRMYDLGNMVVGNGSGKNFSICTITWGRV